MARFRAFAFIPVLLSIGCQPEAAQAPSRAATIDCALSADAPACIVQQVSDGGLALFVDQDLATALIATGHVSEIADRRFAVWSTWEFDRLPKEVLAKPTQPTHLHDNPWSRSRLMVVAIGLAAAAQRSASPLDDPEWLKIAGNLETDPNVVHVAAMIWGETTLLDWNWGSRRPPGLDAILARAVATPPTSNDVLIDVAKSARRAKHLWPAIKQMLVERIGDPHKAKSDQMAQAASLLARLDYPHEAADMLQGGLQAEHYDIPSIEAQIAAAHLRVNGYDAKAARVVLREELKSGSSLFSEGREALEKGRAWGELTELAEAHLRNARSQQKGSLPVVDEYPPVAAPQPLLVLEELALASECFRRAGKTEAAIAAAREGMPKIATALFDKPGDHDFATRRAAAGQDNGSLTAPAIALYAAGAESEAWESGYLSGRDRFDLWRGPKDGFDPQWILDDTDKWLDAFVMGADDDPAFAKRLYEALVRQGTYTDNEVLGLLAADAGDEIHMREQFQTAYREALPKPGETMTQHPKRWSLLQLAGNWKRAEAVLANVRAR